MRPTIYMEFFKLFMIKCFFYCILFENSDYSNRVACVLEIYLFCIHRHLLCSWIIICWKHLVSSFRRIRAYVCKCRVWTRKTWNKRHDLIFLVKEWDIVHEDELFSNIVSLDFFLPNVFNGRSNQNFLFLFKESNNFNR